MLYERSSGIFIKAGLSWQTAFYVFMQKLFDSNHSVSWLECYVKRVGVVGGLCLIELFNSDFKAIKVQKHYKSSRNSIYGKH